VTRNSAGMRLLPNIIGVFLITVGGAWALAGLGYIRETPMSESYIWTGLGMLAILSGAVIIVSVIRARIRLWRFKKGRAI